MIASGNCHKYLKSVRFHSDYRPESTENLFKFSVYLNINLTISFACSTDLQILRVPEARMKSNI